MGKREENKAQKRNALERAALELFLKQGYAFTSVEQIVAQADIARGTYYLYFTDKEELFRHLVQRCLAPLLAKLERCRDSLVAAQSIEDARTAPTLLQSEIMTLLMEHPGSAMLYLRESRAMGPAGEWLRTLAARIDDMTMDIIISLQRKGLLRAMDAQVSARSVTGVVERLVFDVLSGATNLGTLEAIAPEMMELLTKGTAPGAVPRDLNPGPSGAGNASAEAEERRRAGNH